MKRKSKNQLCALAALSVPRHAAHAACLHESVVCSCTCTVLFMGICVRKDMEAQV